MRRNWLEWVVLGVSVLALVGVIGFLAVDGLTDDGQPPDPVIRLDLESAYAGTDGWLVPAVVLNTGDRPAEAATLRATASVAGETEESEITVDYLPAGTEVEVTFGFSERPDGEVSVSVVGFRLP